MWGDTFVLAGRIKGVLLAWTAGLVALATMLDQFAPDRIGAGPEGIVGIFAQTLIVVAALRVDAGTEAQAAIRPLFVRVFGISILSSIAIALGGLLLIVPGVFLLIRWWIAVPVALDRDIGVTDALRESWQLTAAHWAPILGLLLGLLAMLAASMAILYLLGGLGDEAASWPLSLATNLTTYAVTNLGTVSTVAVYRAISDRTTDLRAVFE